MMRTAARWTVTAGALVAGAALASAQDRPAPPKARLAVRAGTVITGTGETLRDVTILCEDGRIVAMGPKVQVPGGTTVLDAAHGVVMPGLVEAGRAPDADDEMTSEITPSIDVLTSLDAGTRALRRLAWTGATTVLVTPGDANVVGGLGAVIKTVPDRDGRPRVVRPRACLKVSLGSGPEAGNYPPRRRPPGLYGRRPTTRMGTAWLLRQAFERSHAPGPEDAPIVDAVKGRLPVRATAHREADLRTIAGLAQRYKFPLVIEGGGEAHRVVPLLQRVKATVVLELLAWPDRDRRGAEGSQLRLDTAALLHTAGIPLALTARGSGRSLLEAAAMAVRNGLPRDAAIRAITSGAAEILGVADQCGVVATGRAADLCVLTGDPVELTTRVRAVVVEGAVVFGG